MELSDLAAVRDPSDLVDRSVVACFHFVGIFDDLVNEVAEMMDEAKLVLRSSALIFVDHSPISVELAFVHVLAADEGEVHRSRIVFERSGDRSADAAPIPFAIREAVPVDA